MRKMLWEHQESGKDKEQEMVTCKEIRWKHAREGGTKGRIDGKTWKRQENVRENKGKYATPRGVQGRLEGNLQARGSTRQNTWKYAAERRIQGRLDRNMQERGEYKDK
jgi:hypothetical protein